MLSSIKPKKLNGTELFIKPDGEEMCHLIDFWRWAYSDLIGNTERGILAEFIVASALGIQDADRISWGKYDLVSQEGIAIEVKTSGYLQTWEQKELSKIVFSIAPTYGWNNEKNEYDTIKKRQADIYVFCVHKHKEKNTVNPLLIEQWDFYICSTRALDEFFKESKSASLKSLIKAGAKQCQYSNLHAEIVALNRDSYESVERQELEPVCLSEKEIQNQHQRELYYRVFSNETYSGEQRKALDFLLKGFSPMWKEVLRLRYEENLTYQEIGAIRGIGKVRVGQIISKSISRLEEIENSECVAMGLQAYQEKIKQDKEKRERESEELHSDSIRILDLDTRGYNALMRQGIDSLTKLYQLTYEELCQFKGVGKDTALEIVQKRTQYLTEKNK